MNGHENRREEKKNAILQAASELFLQYGFDRVTLTEVAKKAHVSKVSIYNFFESKDNLRRIIICGIMDEGLEKSKALLEKDVDFPEKIKEYIRTRISYQGKVSLSFFFDALESDCILKQRFNEFSSASKELLKEFIKEGKQSGFFSPEISNTAIEIYIDIFQSYYVNSTRNKAIIDMLNNNPELAKELNMLFWDGLIQGDK